MTQAATAYDKFSSTKGVTSISRDNNYSYVIDDDWATPAGREFTPNRWGVPVNNYWTAESELFPVMLSVLDRFKISPDISESAPTVFSKFTFARIFSKMEEEIEIRVEMAPKAIRNITLKINARSKGIPNPIIL